jgi:hypothetical protein
LTFRQAVHRSYSLDLHAGDVLLAFTDGVTEAHSPEDVEIGDERLENLLREIAHLSAVEIAARVSGPTSFSWLPPVLRRGLILTHCAPWNDRQIQPPLPTRGPCRRECRKCKDACVEADARAEGEDRHEREPRQARRKS